MMPAGRNAEFQPSPLPPVEEQSTCQALGQDHRGRSSFWRLLWQAGRSRFALVFLGLLFLAALSAPLLPLDPLHQDLFGRLQPPGSLTGGTLRLLGTDQLGRDLLARLLYGARISLLIGSLSVSLAAVLGSLLGLVAGYFGGWADTVIMTAADALLALPFIVLAIAVIGVVGPGLWNIILVLGGTGWVTFAKLVRGRVMELREETFIDAVRVLGGSPARIILRHLLPNVAPLILVDGALQIGQMILSEASLSFLGLGVQPPTPTWGGMLAEGKLYIYLAWWITVLPGLFLMGTVLSVNFLSDHLRDWLDPGLRHELALARSRTKE
jgi:peptide/nickel transport system permease protein